MTLLGHNELINKNKILKKNHCSYAWLQCSLGIPYPRTVIEVLHKNLWFEKFAKNSNLEFHEKWNIQPIFIIWVLCVEFQIRNQITKNQTRTTRMPAFWDTPRRPMITHTSDSHQIPSQNKTKSSYKLKKKLPKIQILKFCKQLYTRHTFRSCLMRCVNMK